MADPKGNLVTPVGFRSDGSIHALELDNTDQLKIAATTVSGEVVVDGKTSGGVATPLLVDASGHPIIDGASPSLLRPIPKSIRFVNLALPAGTSTQTGLTVPANSIYRLTHFAMRYDGTVAGVKLYAIVNTGVDSIVFAFVTPPVSGSVYPQVVNILLNAGWTVEVLVLGATLNDDLYEYVCVEQVL